MHILSRGGLLQAPDTRHRHTIARGVCGSLEEIAVQGSEGCSPGQSLHLVSGRSGEEEGLDAATSPDTLCYNFHISGGEHTPNFTVWG